MCTWSCRISFSALSTPTGGLACSSSTMNFTVAPAKLFFTDSRYISKPLTMSLPTWANGPVIGASMPMRNSSALAGAAANPITTHAAVTAPIHAGVFIVPAPLVIVASVRSLRHRRQCCRPRFLRAPLTHARRYAHQSARQIKNRQHVDAAKRILPPRHQRAEIFPQEHHHGGTDGAAHQGPRAAQHHHEQRIDRGGEHHVLGRHVAVGGRPQHAGQAAEGASDDEGDVFVQPGIVAENAHAYFLLTDAFEAASERRKDEEIEYTERDGEKTE